MKARNGRSPQSRCILSIYGRWRSRRQLKVTSMSSKEGEIIRVMSHPWTPARPTNMGSEWRTKTKGNGRWWWWWWLSGNRSRCQKVKELKGGNEKGKWEVPHNQDLAISGQDLSHTEVRVGRAAPNKKKLRLTDEEMGGN